MAPSRRRTLDTLLVLGATSLTGCARLLGDAENETSKPTPDSAPATSSTASPTPSPTPAPQPTYVQMVPHENDLRRELPAGQTDTLRKQGVLDGGWFTHPKEVVDDTIDTVQIEFDPIGLMHLHYNDYEDVKRHDSYMPEAAIYVHAALGQEDTLRQKIEDAEHGPLSNLNWEDVHYKIETAKGRTDERPRSFFPENTETGWRQYSIEDALNEETLDEFLDHQIPLYQNIEGEFDRGMISTEDAKQAACLEYVARVGAGIQSHFFPLKMRKRGKSSSHGFILAYDWGEDRLFGVDTAPNAVVDDFHEPIEDVHYEDDYHEPWHWDPGGRHPEDPVATALRNYAYGTMLKMVSNTYSDDLRSSDEESGIKSVGVHPDAVDAWTDGIAAYNDDQDVDFADLLQMTLGAVKLMRADGRYVIDVTDQGVPFARPVTYWESVRKVREGDIDDIRNLDVDSRY